MRLVDDDGRLAEHLVRELERAGAGAAGRMARERVPRLLPPDPAVALRRAEPVARVQHLRVRRIRELAPDATREDDADREPGNRERERSETRDALDADAPVGRHLAPAQQPCRARDERRTGDHHEREDQAVVCADRARLPVARDSGKRERGAEHGGTDAAADRDGGEALDAFAVEHDPRRSRNACERDAEARVREQERHREAVQQHDAFDPAPRGEPQRKRHPRRAEKRELVPVVERRAQAREPSVVAVERRHALREERPPDEQTEERSRGFGDAHARSACADEHAEQCEPGIDEGSVRELPRAIGRRRPHHRDPHPERQARRASRGRARRVRRAAAPARAARAASTSATPPIQTSGAFECPPPKKRAQNETAAAARPGASPPSRWPAAGTGGDASIGRNDAKIRSQTVYIGITARTLALERLRAPGVEATPWAGLG